MEKNYITIEDTIINLREVNYIRKGDVGCSCIEIYFKNDTRCEIYFNGKKERNIAFDELRISIGGWYA